MSKTCQLYLSVSVRGSKLVLEMQSTLQLNDIWFSVEQVAIICNITLKEAQQKAQEYVNEENHLLHLDAFQTLTFNHVQDDGKPMASLDSLLSFPILENMGLINNIQEWQSLQRSFENYSLPYYKNIMDWLYRQRKPFRISDLCRQLLYGLSVAFWP